jgi:hypothetical protein
MIDRDALALEMHEAYPDVPEFYRRHILYADIAIRHIAAARTEIAAALPYLLAEKDASIERLTALIADMMVEVAERDAQLEAPAPAAPVVWTDAQQLVVQDWIDHIISLTPKNAWGRGYHDAALRLRAALEAVRGETSHD